MPAAAKAPPMIAPGILCPKCKGPMLDERQNKRTDKSPDYTCANMLCMDKSGKYRTAIWAEKDTPPILKNAATEDAAELAGKIGPDPEVLNAQKAKHALALKHAVEYTMKHIVPMYTEREIGMTGDEVYKHAYTIFQTWEDKGLIE